MDHLNGFIKAELITNNIAKHAVLGLDGFTGEFYHTCKEKNVSILSDLS